MTPKERFFASDLRKIHEAWAASATGEIACETALVTFIESLPEAPSPGAGWDNAMQISGARKFKEILLELYKPTETKKPEKWAGAKLRPPE